MGVANGVKGIAIGIAIGCLACGGAPTSRQGLASAGAHPNLETRHVEENGVTEGVRSSRLQTFVDQTCLLYEGRVLCWGANAFVPSVTSMAMNDVTGMPGDERNMPCGFARQSGLVERLGEPRSRRGQRRPTEVFTGISSLLHLGWRQALVELPSGKLAYRDRAMNRSGVPVETRSIAGLPLHAVVVRTPPLSEGSGCALGTDAIVRCWGDERSWYGIHVELDERLHAEPVVGVGPVTHFDGYGGTACFVTTDGAVWCWRHEDYQERPLRFRGAPYRVCGLSDALQVAAEYEDGCAIRRDGTVVCWKQEEQQAFGSTDSSVSTACPALESIPGPAGVTDLSMGPYWTCAFAEGSGSVWCWGRDLHGVLGPKALETHVVPELAGARTISVRVDRQVCATFDFSAPRCVPTPALPAATPDRCAGFPGEREPASPQLDVRDNGEIWCTGCDVSSDEERDPLPQRLLRLPGAMRAVMSYGRSFFRPTPCVLVRSGHVACGEIDALRRVAQRGGHVTSDPVWVRRGNDLLSNVIGIAAFGTLGTSVLTRDGLVQLLDEARDQTRGVRAISSSALNVYLVGEDGDLYVAGVPYASSRLDGSLGLHDIVDVAAAHADVCVLTRDARVMCFEPSDVEGACVRTPRHMTREAFRAAFSGTRDHP